MAAKTWPSGIGGGGEGGGGKRGPGDIGAGLGEGGRGEGGGGEGGGGGDGGGGEGGGEKWVKASRSLPTPPYGTNTAVAVLPNVCTSPGGSVDVRMVTVHSP